MNVLRFLMSAFSSIPFGINWGEIPPPVLFPEGIRIVLLQFAKLQLSSRVDLSRGLRDSGEVQPYSGDTSSLEEIWESAGSVTGGVISSFSR